MHTYIQCPTWKSVTWNGSKSFARLEALTFSKGCFKRANTKSCFWSSHIFLAFLAIINHLFRQNKIHLYCSYLCKHCKHLIILSKCNNSTYGVIMIFLPLFWWSPSIGPRPGHAGAVTVTLHKKAVLCTWFYFYFTSCWHTWPDTIHTVSWQKPR